MNRLRADKLSHLDQRETRREIEASQSDRRILICEHIRRAPSPSTFAVAVSHIKVLTAAARSRNSQSKAEILPAMPSTKVAEKVAIAAGFLVDSPPGEFHEVGAMASGE